MVAQTVAVVGGGAVGVTTASELARRGADVTLYERSQIAGGSTGRAAGILYDVFGSDEEVEMAARAYQRFEEFDASGSQFEFRKRPFVWFAQEGDEESVAALERRVEAMRALGRSVRLVDPEDVADEFPAVSTSDVAAAARTDTAGYADPHQYTMWMADRARERGVAFEIGDAVGLSVDPPRVSVAGETREVDAVVVAAGVHTARLLGDAGLSVPIKPYRVQALTCSPVDGDVDAVREATPIIHDKTDNFYYRPDAEGVLGGGGPGSVSEVSDPTDWKRSADLSFVTGIAADLERRFPEFELAMSSSWAGLCAGTPDQRPIVGAVTDGVYVAAGWQGHGFMRSPAAGELVADAVCDGATPPAAFSPGRFTGDEDFRVVTGLSSH